jgi:hypothetical protein
VGKFLFASGQLYVSVLSIYMYVCEMFLYTSKLT